MARAPLPGLVARPALADRLEEAAAGPVTVVVAPAGSGKTALVRAWLDGRGPGSAAWVSVERGERDPHRFWATVRAELRAAAPAGARVEAPALTPEHRGPAVVERLATDLSALEERLVLVVDDLHELAGTTMIAELELLLARLPAAVHVVLITRRDLPLGLHRRKLAGEVTELRSADLRFSVEETRELLSELGISLSPEAVAALHERTEGWVAGLRLAAFSLAVHPEPERFVREFSGSERSIAGYLLAEVLDSQPEDVRRLLVRASILPRVNGALGDLLTGAVGSERRLRELARAGGFVIELDAAGTWFRFHHLFADLLAAELRHAEPEAVPGLHRAAAGWHAEHGDVVQAIAHAQAAGESEQAVGLLIDHYFSLALDGRRATAHALLEAFGPSRTQTSPELATVVADDQLAEGSLDQAAAYLALAERHAGAVPEARRERWQMARLVTRLSLARRLGDFRSVQAEVAAADRLVDPRTPRDIEINADVRALTLLNLGIVEAWTGRAEEGAAHLSAAREVARRSGRPFLEVSCLAHRAQAESWRSFARARRTSYEAIELAERHGWGEDPVIAPALVVLVATLVQAGRLDEAEAWLRRADAALRADLEPAVGALLQIAHGAVHAAAGRPADALRHYAAAECFNLVLVAGSPLSLRLRSSVLAARLALGELAEVRAALDAMAPEECDAGETVEVRAALALAEGDPEAASAVLAPTLRGEADVRHPTVLVTAALLEARARDALDDAAGCAAAVERALEAAEPDALVLPFLLQPVGPLLERHPRFSTAHGAFVIELLDVLSGRGTARRDGPAPELSEPLSDAELRVLRLLPTNLPAAGIAGELHVSVHTVKTHMRHVYAKLDVHSRAHAVSRSRALGLLGHSLRRA